MTTTCTANNERASLSAVAGVQCPMVSKCEVIIFAMLFVVSSAVVNAQTFPAGFSRVRVVPGLTNPTVMAFAPDGRIFVCEQAGTLRVVKNDVLLPTPFVTLNVSASGERGLIGIVLDPNFAFNGYVYLYYTLQD